MKYSILAVSVVFIFSSYAMAAAITGVATYQGSKPKLREIKMDADPICLMKHGEVVYPQSIVLGENNELKNVFVQIVEGLPKKAYPIPSEPVVLDQKGCMYEPATFGVMVGQALKILNPDGTLHNVHCLSKINPEFNLAMPKFRTEVTRIFEKPELQFQIKCDVHPWMVTWGNVVDHPFFDVTDQTGRYSIENLPAGDYVIEAWQQRLSTQRVNVKIAEGENKEINFTFSRPDGK